VTKSTLAELAVYGGTPVFAEIRSTSNLVTPDVERFLHYARQSYDAGWLTNNGPMVRLMEERLAELHGVSDCVATCNGLWALVLCIHCLAPEGRREIVMPSLTYRRMADIAAWLGLVPRFCDVEPGSLGVSAATVQPCVNGHTALILAPHPIVHLCDIDGLTALSGDSGIPLLFDSVEAAYASHSGTMVGSFGDAEVFSMHASKFLNAFEAGYITTNNRQLADELRLKRAFGYFGPDRVRTFGLNAKLNEFHAAMALASLEDLHDQVERNRARYLAYRELLADVPGVELVEYSESEKRGFKNILVRLTDAWPLSRERTLDILHAENLLARPYYFPALHDRPTAYPTAAGALPVTDRLKHEYMLLPSGAFLEQDEVPDVVALLGYLQSAGAELESGE